MRGHRGHRGAAPPSAAPSRWAPRRPRGTPSAGCAARRPPQASASPTAATDGPPSAGTPLAALLRAELDAAFFDLYGLSRDDAAYILDTFPIVRKNDEKAHGEYRTKRVILEIYDAMTEAARTGVPYVTRLDPPPADPRVAHPPRPPAPVST